MRRRNSPEFVRTIRLEAAGKSHGIIAMLERKHGRPRGSLSRIIRGDTWRDIDDAPPVTSSAPKLTPDQLVEVRRMFQGGVSVRRITQQFGISRPALERALAHAYLGEPVAGADARDRTESVGAAVRPEGA